MLASESGGAVALAPYQVAGGADGHRVAEVFVVEQMLANDTDVPGSDEADRLAADYGLTKCADGSTEE